MNFDTDGVEGFSKDDHFYNDSAGWLPISEDFSEFTANFNGNGYTISNLTINRTQSSDVGFFGYLINDIWDDNPITIENVRFENARVNGNSYCGILAGRIQSYNNILIKNMVLTGSVDCTDNAGALTGAMATVGASIYLESSYIESSITSNTNYNYAGGIAGQIFNNGTIVLTNNIVAADVTGNSRIGATIGKLNTYKDSYLLIKNNLIAGSITTGDFETSGALTGEWYVGDDFEFLIDANYFNTTRHYLYSSDSTRLDLRVAQIEITTLSDEEITMTGDSILTHVHKGLEPAEPSELSCPTSPDNEDCSNTTLFKGWNTPSVIWDFGTSSDLPGIIIGDSIYRYTEM